MHYSAETSHILQCNPFVAQLTVFAVSSFETKATQTHVVLGTLETPATILARVGVASFKIKRTMIEMNNTARL